jgi:ABC-2 type transport system ATP-binding protein
MSIEAKNVSKFYGKQAALKDVGFSVGKGEVVGFLGPNGAGKSTMMKIITCYLPPNKGDVKVAGHDIYDESLKVRKKVGYLPETNPLYPEMYIREYLMFVAGIYGLKKRKDRVAEMIDMVGLQAESHKKISALSKGYRQRVGLAQALIHDPEVLILDEPTSGLDPNQLDEIRLLIKKIGSEKTVLLSTHIMQEVEAICNRVIIIKEGQIVKDSPLSTLKSEDGPEVIVLHLNKAISEKKVKSIDGVKSVVETGPGNYRIEVEKGQNVLGKLNALATSEDAEVEELRKESRSLESVFKSLTR